MSKLPRLEAPGALNNGFLKELVNQPKGPIWPKVPVIGPLGPSRRTSQGRGDRVPGHLYLVQPYVSVAPVGLVRYTHFCQLKSTLRT